MKPVLKKKNENVILINKITINHIIVGLDLNNDPVILTNENYNIEKYKLTLLNREFTQNNGYGNFKSIKKLVEFYMNSGWKLEVFHQKDWKKALQWLIDNVE